MAVNAMQPVRSSGYAICSDEESGHASQHREPSSTWEFRPSTADLVMCLLLVVASVATIGLMLVRDLTASAAEPCDVLSISKHIHCVNTTGIGQALAHAKKPPTFSDVLDAQGTKREHYSVVEATRQQQQREHAQHHQPPQSGRPATPHRHSEPHRQPTASGAGHAESMTDAEQLDFETDFAAGEEWLDPAV